VLQQSMFQRFFGGRTMVIGLAVAGLMPATAARAAVAGPTLYVAPAGDDGNACTQAAPCLTIGHAVSVATPHGRILVGPGTYAEEVQITKSLDLEGRGAMIDASGLERGIYVTGADAAGSRVAGFTVENATFEGIRVESTSRVTIANNVVQQNDQGASSPEPAGECAPQGPVPGDCGEGLRLLAVSRSLVVNNTVRHNVGGILMTDELGPTHDNQVLGNTVTDNAEDCGITMPSHNPVAASDPTQGGVYRNRIVGNVSRANGGAGIGMFAAPPGGATYDNVVAGNTIIGNGEGGVNIHSHAPQQNVSGNAILNNEISGNGIDPDSGSTEPNGLSFLTVSDPQTELVSGNRISDEYYGIFMAGPFRVRGLAGNVFDPSVTVPVSP
jgi:hypothetical protein